MAPFYLALVMIFLHIDLNTGNNRYLRTLNNPEDDIWVINKYDDLQDDPLTVIEIIQRKPTSDSETDDTDSDEDLETSMSNDITQPGILRSVWKGFQKTGAKVCKKACVAAYRNVCYEFDCRSKMKRRFKKECKKMCTDKFLNS